MLAPLPCNPANWEGDTTVNPSVRHAARNEGSRSKSRSRGRRSNSYDVQSRGKRAGSQFQASQVNSTNCPGTSLSQRRKNSGSLTQGALVIPTSQSFPGKPQQVWRFAAWRPSVDRTIRFTRPPGTRESDVQGSRIRRI